MTQHSNVRLQQSYRGRKRSGPPAASTSQLIGKTEQPQLRLRLASYASKLVANSHFRYRAPNMSDCGAHRRKAGFNRTFLCKQLGCVFCHGGRVAKSRRVLKHLEKIRFHSQWRVLWATVTLRSVEPSAYGDSVDTLHSALSKLRGWAPFTRALGVLTSQEFTCSRKGEIHPHAHTLFVFRSKEEYKKAVKVLQSKFQKAAGLHYAPRVHIGKPVLGGNVTKISKLAKYCMKLPSINTFENLLSKPNRYLEIYQALNRSRIGKTKKRLVSTSGVFNRSKRAARDRRNANGAPTKAPSVKNVTTKPPENAENKDTFEGLCEQTVPETCPISGHDDKNPSSCGLFADDRLWHCFPCGQTGDVLDACVHLEGRPQSGRAWVTDTLVYLAREFGIPVDLPELTEEQQFELDTYRAHAQALKLVVTGEKSDAVKEKLAGYGWSEKTLNKIGIGGVLSTRDYLLGMEAAGYSKSFLHKIDLDNPRIFHPDCLIYAVKDEHGNAVGFSARNLRYETAVATARQIAELEGEESVEASKALQSIPPKYVNSTQFDSEDNSPRNAIYQKGKRLFGLHTVKPKAKKLWIVEGNADVVTSFNAGVANTVGLCSNHLTKEHLALILEQGITHLIFVMDGDDGGRKGVDSFVRLVDECLSNRPGIRIELILLEGGADPDSFIREKGANAYTDLPRVSLFAWRLKHAIETGEDNITVAREAIGLIVNESEAIQRHVMIIQLADVTGIPVATLNRQVEEILYVEEIRSEEQVFGIAERLSLQLKRNPKSAAQIIAAAAMEVENVSVKSYGATTSSIQQITDAIFDANEKTIDTVALKTGYPLWDQRFGGIPIGAAFLTMPGKPNHGKSSALSCLTVGVLDNNSDVIVLAHTVDDILRDYMNRLFGVKYKFPSKFFKEAGKHLPDNEKFRQAFFEFKEWKREMVETEKLVMVDVTMLPGTLSAFESKIKQLRRSYPSRPIVAIGDNFHLYDSGSGSDADGEAHTRNMSKKVKSIANHHDVCVMMTMELPKLPDGVKPRLSKIKGSAGVSYDSSGNIGVYNDKKDSREQSHMIWKDKDNETRPILELIFDKSKILNGYDGALFYKFHEESGYMEELSENEQKSWYEKSLRKPGYGGLSTSGSDE